MYCLALSFLAVFFHLTVIFSPGLILTYDREGKAPCFPSTPVVFLCYWLVSKLKTLFKEEHVCKFTLAPEAHLAAVGTILLDYYFLLKGKQAAVTAKVHSSFLPSSHAEFSNQFSFLETKQSHWYSATFLSPQPSQRGCASSSRKCLEMVLVTDVAVCLQLFFLGAYLGHHLAPSLLVFLHSKAPNPQSSFLVTFDLLCY